MKNRTLTIIKPDIVQQNLTGQVIDHLLSHGFEIMAMKMVRLTSESAGEFYAVHKGKPFYESLVEFMTESPVFVMVLKKADAVAELRRVVGATDPKDAQKGTVRQMYGTDKGRNAIHASDSDENADIEMHFFFSAKEMIETST